MKELTPQERMREQLSSVSPSFCLAKWLQVTLHLHSGHNHSCHHPNTHKTPLSELAMSPSALHNTCFKKDQRRKMKVGERPSECGYCWNIEDLGPSFLSDRSLKSSEYWAKPFFEKVANLPANADINPTYVEVSFSNACNFRCSYCSGNFSTRWKEDINKHGSYSTKSGEQTMDILPEENNPYIKAFWDWWPSLVKDLKVFRITGGEPLLSKNTFRVLENLSENPMPDLEVAVNSNLGVSDAAFQKFIEHAKDLTENSKVRRFGLYTSVDAWGKRADYIRNGLDFERFKRNLETYLKEVPRGRVTIMVTFNALSLTSFMDLLVYVRDLKKQYTHDGFAQLGIDMSYLRHPIYQNVQVLTEDFHRYMEEIIQFMKANVVPEGRFELYEIFKAERILEWMKQPVEEQDIKQRRKEFHVFFDEHDRRRSTDFLATFPEMKAFWELCASHR